MLESEGRGFFVSAFDPVRATKRLLRRLPVRFARLDVSETASLTSPAAPPAGTYRIVNYHPRYYLMADDYEGGDASSRARSWAAERDYHEHRDPRQQHGDARAFSEWFARWVIAPTQPRRVLELGCGAGRNLVSIQRNVPGVEVVGVEINPEAAAAASRATGAHVVCGSVYDLPDLGSFNVAFTTGVLMHVPHDRAPELIRRMVEMAERTAHFELHGQPHGFDFHRYPRDYAAVYRRLGLTECRYEVFPRGDVRNRGESVGTMALLICPPEGPIGRSRQTVAGSDQ
jgi:SAM-dependent methyltransferase